MTAESRGMDVSDVRNDDPLMTAAQACRYCGLPCGQSGASIRRLCRLGALAHVRLAGKVLVRKSELDRLIQAHTRPARGTA